MAVLMLAPLDGASAQSATSQPGYNSADVDFIQGMISHHAQAIVMSSLVASHTTRENIRTAARRIINSQRDEIAMMGRWLQRRGQIVPAVDTAPIGRTMGAMPGMQMGESRSRPMMMPGMLTHAQLQQLAAARGARFDSLFLSGMIRHHQGALTMVAKLFATTGATQDAEIFQLASDIDSDQRAEIARMQSMFPTHPKR